MNQNIAQAKNRCDNQLDWLLLLAQQAESHFWATAQSGYSGLGEVGELPYSSAEAMCAAAQMCNAVIQAEAAAILGVTGMSLEDVQPLLETRSLYIPDVQSVVSTIKDILNVAIRLSDPPVGGIVHPTMADAGPDMLDQILEHLNRIGPHFPGVFTPRFPVAAFTGLTVTATETDEMTVVLGTGTWPTTTWNGLAAGDIVVLTRLDLATSDPVNTYASTYLNRKLAVHAVDGATLTLVLDPTTTDEVAALSEVRTSYAPGDTFVLRKIRAVEEA